MFGGDDEGFAEKTAAAVCDVVGEEGFAELIEFGEVSGRGVGVEDEWKRSARELLKIGASVVFE